MLELLVTVTIIAIVVSLVLVVIGKVYRAVESLRGVPAPPATTTSG